MVKKIEKFVCEESAWCFETEAEAKQSERNIAASRTRCLMHRAMMTVVANAGIVGANAVSEALLEMGYQIKRIAPDV